MTLKNWNPNNLTPRIWSLSNWTPKNWSSNIWTPKNWSPRKLDSKKLEFVYLDSKKLESKKLSFWVWCFLVKTRIWKAGNACIVLRRLRRRPSKWNWVRRRPQSKVENLLKSVKKFSVVPPSDLGLFQLGWSDGPLDGKPSTIITLDLSFALHSWLQH